MEQIEEFVINLDYANISSLDDLSAKEKYIAYIQYDYIYKLRNLQVFLNSRFNELEVSNELLKIIRSFINIKELNFFYEYLKSFEIKNLREFELFFEAIKLNYELMVKQYGSPREINITMDNYARIKGVYYPNYEKMEVLFKWNNDFYKKTEILEELVNYIVKPIF